MNPSRRNRRHLILEILEEKSAPSGGISSFADLNVHAERAPRGATTFSAHLTGSHEIPQRTTPANGRILALTNIQETKLVLRGTLKKLTNVDTITLNLGSGTTNGQPVAMLLGPLGADGGPFMPTGVHYVVRSSSLIGPLAGHPLADLVKNLRAGNVYINVGTLRTFPIQAQSVHALNTGPGDFPDGEIRGQFHAVRS
jgi:CHRD domain